MSSPNFGATSDMMRVNEPWSGGGGWGSGGSSTGGSNQYMSYPALPNFNTPVSTSGSGPTQQLGFGSQQYPWQTWQHESGFKNTPGGNYGLMDGYTTAPTMDPAFTNQFYSMLSQLMGQGQGVQNNLLSFLQGGPSSTPGAGNLASLANTGNPISTLPEWQAMLDAQQRNIGENQANLKEQFAFSGDLQSSPFGTAMTDYMTQTTKDQNALLGNLQTTALENAQNRGLQASMGVEGMAANESQFLNSLFSSAALTSPQVLPGQKSSGLGGLGSLLGAIPGIGSIVGSIGEGLSGGGGLTDVLSSLGGLFMT